MSKHDLIQIMAAAMDHASEGICITDPHQPDNPLIYVNQGFLKLTGYTYEEVIGKNPRFLQGADTDPELVNMVRSAIQEKRAVQTEIINYRKNGEPFINKMSVSPVFNEMQELTHFVGVQEDITAYKRKIEIEGELERQRLMAEVMLQAAEKERREIGMELHDNINQILTTAKLHINHARDNQVMCPAMIGKSMDLINKAIQEIRKISGMLTGPMSKELSFKESLQELINTIKTAAPFKIVYNDDELDEGLLSETQQLTLYRIIQEQLTNIIRHAKATTVTIHFLRQGNSLVASIRDNGVGFCATQITEGIGLRNIRSRIEMEKGSMYLRSEPGAGCELLMKIPLVDETTG